MKIKHVDIGALEQKIKNKETYTLCRDDISKKVFILFNDELNIYYLNEEQFVYLNKTYGDGHK